MSERQSRKAAVEQLANSLKSQVAPGIASNIDTRMEELTEKWRNLGDKLSQRKTGEKIELFNFTIRVQEFAL